MEIVLILDDRHCIKMFMNQGLGIDYCIDNAGVVFGGVIEVILMCPPLCLCFKRALLAVAYRVCLFLDIYVVK